MASPTPAAIYKHYGLPVPQRERVVRVFVNARDLQPEVLEGYADKLAEVFVTAAMAQGCTRAELHFPNRQSVILDLDSVRKATVAELGYWPTLPAGEVPIPTRKAVTELQGVGAHFEPSVTQVPVPASLEPSVRIEPQPVFPADPGTEGA